MVNAEIPSAAKISMCAMCWDCKTLGTVKQFRYKHAQRMETMKQSGLWSSLGTHGSVVVIWWLCISSSGETREFDFLNQIWSWRSRSIANQNNRDLNQGQLPPNQGLLPLWSKFGNPSLNGSRVLTRTSDWHTHTHRHTHRRRRWQYPKAKTVFKGLNASPQNVPDCSLCHYRPILKISWKSIHLFYCNVALIHAAA